MRQLLALAALSFLFFSCNNGGYDTDPNTTNNTNCPVPIADTVCSCTGDFSFYMNGVLYSVIPAAAHDDTNPTTIDIFGADTAGKEIKIEIQGYTGPGTYEFSAQNLDFFFYTDEDLNVYATTLPCTGGKVVITYDAAGEVKGTFYAVAKDVVSGAMVAIKGGNFVAPWQN